MEILEFYHMHNHYCFPGRFSPKDLELIGKEIRSIRTKSDLIQYVGKAKDPEWLKHIDDVLYQSFKEVQ